MRIIFVYLHVIELFINTVEVQNMNEQRIFFFNVYSICIDIYTIVFNIFKLMLKSTLVVSHLRDDRGKESMDP